MENNTGVIKGLNDKGFGFIKVEGHEKDLFFHASALKGVRFNELRQGDRVVFEDIEQGEKGKVALGVSLE